MTKVIAIVCHKGGVGKTTTAASLGGYLSMKGEKVLLVDLDPQQNLTYTFMDKGAFAGQETVMEAFSGKCALPVYNIRENLDIVPSSPDMCSFDFMFSGKVGREFMLQELLEPVKGRYDWVLLDCSAMVAGATPNALVAADYVVVPINADHYSLDGYEQINELIQPVQKRFNRKLKLAGILMTRYNGRRMVDHSVEDSLREHYPGKVFRCRIRECAAFSKAPFGKTDIFSFEPSSKGAEDYETFALELADTIETLQEDAEA